MALVLGPELDLFLRGIGEDLKGKTILEEPYVDRKTIIRAVSEQNKVILELQSQLYLMKEAEKKLEQTYEMVQEKVTYLEKYAQKVDDIEAMLREKVPLLDKVHEKVNQHDVSIDKLTSKTKENALSLTAFKSEARGFHSQLRNDLESIPEKIIITSRQVTHSSNDVEDTPRDDNGSELLVDIIAQQKQHIFVQDENMQNLEAKVEDVEKIQNEWMVKVKRNVSELMEWKQAQSNVDLETIKANQEDMKVQIDQCVDAINRKMSKEDVDMKLNHQFDDIVNHLQSALSSIENEEADFKCITDSLSKMCESLREKKADKTDLVALRKQFIDNQVEGLGPRAGSTLDNESIRRILANYPTKDSVLKMLQNNGCGGIPEIVRIDSRIQLHQSILEQLLNLLSSDGTNMNHNDLGAFLSRLKAGVSERSTSVDESNCPENSHPTMEEMDDKSEVIEHVQRSMSYNVKSYKNFDRDSKSCSDSSFTTTSEQRKGEINHFPSSNVIKGVLSKVHHDEQAHGPSNVGNLPTRNQMMPTGMSAPNKRPISAPYQKAIPESNIMKKHSLPAILTSISKTMRPRSKMKSRHDRQRGGVVYNGNYQVIDASVKFDPQWSSSESRPLSSEHMSGKKQVKIRSIE